MKDSIKTIYQELKSREIHPSGSFDSAGRWYAEHSEFINVREPSRAFPYSQMTACRTLKYVKAVCAEFDCKTEDELRKMV